MRLLILTQKVDVAGDVLGFFYSWILEFSRHFEKVTVICLEEGAHNLPSNVSVFSLGKETGKSRIKYIWRFLYFIFRERKNYDVVFVHMNPEYVVLGGIFWRLLRKKIGLWYVHRQVNLKLRIAEKLAHVIFSTTKEAFRLQSRKVHFLGHGVDFTYFHRKPETLSHMTICILHVGRITPIKNLDILIEAAAILKNNWGNPFDKTHGKQFKIILAGAPSALGDKEYEKRLKELVQRLGLTDEISFVGKVSFAHIAELYKEADISVNLTPTGGMDKAVLESIASGTPVLSANRAFKELFGEYSNYLLYNERDPADVAEKLRVIGTNDNLRRIIQEYLYQKVRKNFSLENLVMRIITLFKK